MSDKILSRGDLVSTVAQKTGLSAKDVDAAVKAYESAIAQSLKEGGEIRLVGFGTFKTSERGERTSRNPRTGEPITVAARSVVRFTPSKNVKDSVAKGE